MLDAMLRELLMKWKVGCQLDYNLAGLTTFVFNIAIAGDRHQRCLEEQIRLTPAEPLEEHRDARGNRYWRVSSAAEHLTVTYEATAVSAPLEGDPASLTTLPVASLPMDVLPYLYPSRYCQSDRLMTLARREFGAIAQGYEQVQALCEWIYHHVAYQGGSTDVHTSACDTLLERRGVCRDFAHLAIALCRALEIPARFVSVYAHDLNPPDFHACFEVYLGDRWYVFDATRLAPRQGFIRIATGRDAADVAFCTLFGPGQMTNLQIWADCLESNPALHDDPKRAIAL